MCLKNKLSLIVGIMLFVLSMKGNAFSAVSSSIGYRFYSSCGTDEISIMISIKGMTGDKIAAGTGTISFPSCLKISRMISSNLNLIPVDSGDGTITWNFLDLSGNGVDPTLTCLSIVIYFFYSNKCDITIDNSNPEVRSIPTIGNTSSTAWSFQYPIGNPIGSGSYANILVHGGNACVPSYLRLINLPIGKQIILNTPYWREWKIITETGIFQAFHMRGEFTLTVKADGYEEYSKTIFFSNDDTIDVSLKTLHSSVGSQSPCISVKENLVLNICADYQEKKYACTLKLQNICELIWQLDLATFRELSSDPGNCISVGSSLKLDMCAEYQGHNYNATLNFYPNSKDSDGLYWKLDVGAFKEIH